MMIMSLMLRASAQRIDSLNHGWAKEVIDLLVEVNIKRKIDGEAVTSKL